MRVVNETRYETRGLRAILTRVAQDELEADKRRRVVVTVKPGRGIWERGEAYVGGTQVTIWLPSPERGFRRSAFAMVAAHEYAHLRGLGHSAMRGGARYNWDGLERYAWAVEIPVAVKQAKRRDPQAEAAKRLAHARAQFKRALTRVKRANTFAKKWQRRVKALERNSK